MSAKTHYNSVASGIDQCLMRDQRRAHNMVKATCVKEALYFCGASADIVVVDLACGRGGDLPKLANHNVQYHGVDIAEHALQETIRRFHEMSVGGNIHTYCADAADAKLSVEGSADVVLMNFALHYFTDTEEHCTRLMQQVKNALRPGGIFCGVYTRSRFVPQSTFTSATHWPTDGQFNAQPWGHRYRFNMPPFVDADEYLIPMQHVINIAYKHRLYLMKDRGILEYARVNGIDTTHIDRMYGIFMFIRT